MNTLVRFLLVNIKYGIAWPQPTVNPISQAPTRISMTTMIQMEEDLSVYYFTLMSIITSCRLCSRLLWVMVIKVISPLMMWNLFLELAHHPVVVTSRMASAVIVTPTQEKEGIISIGCLDLLELRLFIEDRKQITPPIVQLVCTHHHRMVYQNYLHDHYFYSREKNRNKAKVECNVCVIQCNVYVVQCNVCVVQCIVCVVWFLVIGGLVLIGLITSSALRVKVP